MRLFALILLPGLIMTARAGRHCGSGITDTGRPMLLGLNSSLDGRLEDCSRLGGGYGVAEGESRSESTKSLTMRLWFDHRLGDTSRRSLDQNLALAAVGRWRVELEDQQHGQRPNRHRRSALRAQRGRKPLGRHLELLCHWLATMRPAATAGIRRGRSWKVARHSEVGSSPREFVDAAFATSGMSRHSRFFLALLRL
jgi:hypothetical protein